MVLLVLALCTVVSYCGISAIFIDWLALLLKGLFGYGYCLAGPAFLFASGILMFHHGRPVRLRVTCALLLPVLFGVLGHMIFVSKTYNPGFGILKVLWQDGVALKCGGAVSGALAAGSVAVFSKVASIVIFLVLFAVLLMAALRLTPAALVEKVRNRPVYEEEPEPDVYKRQNLGRVVTALMKERFSDIADLKFTAHMEQQLDSVEEGKTAWKDVLRDFYGDFDQNLKQAEQALEGVRIKVPDEVSEEICPECGRNLVVKSGRFGRFLACPGYPECSFTMPLVVEMPGRCPKCGGRLMKRTGTSKKTNKQYTYYCCEFLNSKDESRKCDFMTWDVPVKDDCPVCGQTMFKRAGRGFKKPFCINPACSNFLPEEKRGYPRKPAQDKTEGAAEEAAEQSAAETATKKTAAKKTAAKKAPAKKTAKAAAAKTEEKATVKKTVKKTAASTAKKTAAKKTTTAKKPAAKKPAAKKTAKKAEDEA